VLQGDDWMFTNNEEHTIRVKELSGGWDNGTAPGIDYDADHSD